MECYKCGAALGRENDCPACGADVKLYRKIIHLSNLHYNLGLERAKVRDLSGAAESLKKSLKYYKMNIPARNLLGLVYFEMGETVDALSEWVISKSLCPEDNAAERYLGAVQSNGNKLEALNQTIKKYNQALLYCKQGSRDLAMIQLKKVLALNPKLVRGHQLLALLYIQEGRYDLAKISLRNAGRVDANNTTTLRYLREVNIMLHGGQPSQKNRGKDKEEKLVAYQSGNETIIRPATFKDNSAFLTILNIVVGVVVGVLITWFLIVPSVKQNAVSDARKEIREINENVSTKNQTIKTLENQISGLEGTIEQMKADGEASQSVLGMYEQLLVACDAYAAENYEEAGAALESVDGAALAGKAAEVYQSVSVKINEKYIVTLFDQGESSYNRQDYGAAAEKLQKVVNLDESYDDWNAVYHLARCYHNLEQKEQAVAYYQKLIEQKPGTERARNSQRYLEELGQSPAQDPT